MSSSPEYCTSCGKEMFANALFCTYCGMERLPVQNTETQGSAKHLYEIRKVGIWSVAKLFAIINAFTGLIIGLFSGLLLTQIRLPGMGIGNLPFPIEGSGLVGTGAWMLLLILLPVTSGFMGAIFGMIMGTLYNLMAWLVGGIRITLKSK